MNGEKTVLLLIRCPFFPLEIKQIERKSSLVIGWERLDSSLCIINANKPRWNLHCLAMGVCYLKTIEFSTGVVFPDSEAQASLLITFA